MSNKLDTQYQSLLKDILQNGHTKSGRNGGTLSVFGRQIRHKMSEGFPLITTKKVYWKGVVEELLWFLRGETNIAPLVKKNVNIWVGDAYKAYLKKDQVAYNRLLEESLNDKSLPSLPKYEPISIEQFTELIKTDEKFATEYGELGPVYGKQWRKWDAYEFEGGPYDQECHHKPIDQIDNLVNDLRNNPDSRRLMVNAWNVSDVPNVVLPPCFLGETLVKCRDLYKPISSITTDDKVLTIDGSYREVSELHSTFFDGNILDIKVCGTGDKISCTANHPFLVKGKGFVEAGQLEEGDFLAIPINQQSILPSFTNVDNRFLIKETSELIDNPDWWYVMGYFLGDGWLSHKRNEIYFSISEKQQDVIVPKLKKVIGLGRLNSSGKSCKKYVGKNNLLFTVLSCFGHHAESKCIPQFVHDAPIEFIDMFLMGYKDADGCETKDGKSFTTVSQHIAYGLQLLFAKTGTKALVYHQKRPSKTTIEGRTVNQANTFSVNVYKGKNRSSSFVFEDEFLWMKISNLEKRPFKGYVFNISVNDNHTYTSYNYVNHNCHYGFQCYTHELSLEDRINWAKKNECNFDVLEAFGINSNESMESQAERMHSQLTVDWNVPTRGLSLQWTQRSVDTALGLPFNIASYGLLLCLLAKHVHMVPYELVGILADTHIYLNQIDGVNEQIVREPFALPTVTIDDKPMNDVADYTFDNIKLIGYESHSAIKMPLSN